MSAQHRILVVDDNESTRLLIARILMQELPVDATLAASSEEARQELMNARFDVVLLDLLMPETSGFGVLEWLRAEKTPNQNTPVLVVSVLHDDESIERCRSLGASIHIVKPIFRDTLVAAVRPHLESRSRQEEQGTKPSAA
jgi:CheY-like chemotaxis protein